MNSLHIFNNGKQWNEEKIKKRTKKKINKNQLNLEIKTKNKYWEKKTYFSLI